MWGFPRTRVCLSCFIMRMIKFQGISGAPQLLQCHCTSNQLHCGEQANRITCVYPILLCSYSHSAKTGRESWIKLIVQDCEGIDLLLAWKADETVVSSWVHLSFPRRISQRTQKQSTVQPSMWMFARTVRPTLNTIQNTKTL